MGYYASSGTSRPFQKQPAAGCARMDLGDAPESQRQPVGPVHPGRTIQRERLDRGLSIRELARRVRLNPSHLSKIERGLANPSVGALWTICDELGIAVAELFSREAASGGALRSTELAGAPEVVRNGIRSLSLAFAPAVDPKTRESIKMAGVEFQRLTPHDDAAIEFIEVRHEIGAGDAEAYHHRGREYGLVLEGRLLVEIGFGKYVLEPGWSIAFDSSNPHRVVNVGDGPAVAVWLVIGRNQP